MKKNIQLVVSIAFVGMAIFAFNNLRAQDQPAAPSTPPPNGQVPPQGPRSGRVRPPNFGYRQVIFFLKRAQSDLQRSQDDYGGHRQSAIDACAKAEQELEAVQASIQATEAAKRQQQQQQQQPSGNTNTPAPPQ